MKITIETDNTELAAMIAERDGFRDKIASLSYAPPAASVEKMAQEIEEQMRQKGGFTSDQREAVSVMIRRYTGLN